MTAFLLPVWVWRLSIQSWRAAGAPWSALKGTDIEQVDFEEALGKLKVVPQRRYDEAAVLFG